jgi:hypothetical protein
MGEAGHSEQYGKAEAKTIFSIFAKTFLSEGFLVTSIYAFSSALNAFSNEILFKFFAAKTTKKLRAQEKKICRLALHCEEAE